MRPLEVIWEGTLSILEVGFDCRIVVSARVRQTPARQLDGVDYYRLETDVFGNQHYAKMPAEEEASVRERILARLLLERHHAGAK